MKLADVEDHMKKAIESTQRSFNTIRTGRANSSLLDRVMVEYYGTPTPLKSLANISTPDATTIAIQPYDKGSLNQIEKAISLSDVGLTPSNDGSIIRQYLDSRNVFFFFGQHFINSGRIFIR